MDSLVARALEQETRGGSTGEGIAVAIFDTWPQDKLALSDRRQLVPNAAPPAPLPAAVQECLDALKVQPYPVPDWRTTNSADLPSLHTNCDGVPDDDPYDMADHGLFVADIVRDIAPIATISVYRVLSDEGIGDLWGISQAVEAAIGSSKGKKLILNLSLGWAPPALLVGPLLDEADKIYDNPARLQNWLDVRLPRVAASRRTAMRIAYECRLLRSDGLLDAKTNRFTGALALADALFPTGSEDILAVAAAGNDSCYDRLRSPRFPAAVNGVLGVSAGVPDADAGSGSLRRSSFSNDDDYFGERTRFDGIGAFGGDIASERDRAVPAQAFIGLFVSPHIPAITGPAANTCGLAVWEGTSFSTPVVAGFAAALWSEAQGLTADEVRRKITSLRDAEGRTMEYLPLLRM